MTYGSFATRLRRGLPRLTMALAVAFTSGPVSAATGMEEEFLFTEVGVMPGMLTRLERSKVPVAVTTITAEDIKLTPARNLKDLIETYVPGALWIIHGGGNYVNMRGLVSNRNDKILLVVNGQSFVQKGHDISVVELESWDLNDIEKVEVMRGPGSVTYGPGAITGVISITTKDLDTAQGIRTGGQFVQGYNSRGTYASYGGREDEGLQLYLYGSTTETMGTYPNLLKTGGPNGDFSGYRTFQAGETKGSLNNFFADFDGKNQYKLHAQLRFGDGWNLWSRFTREGVHLVGATGMVNDRRSVPGNASPIQIGGVQEQHRIVVLEKSADITPLLSVKFSGGHGSFNHKRRNAYQSGTPAGHTRNYEQTFSEDNTFAKLQGNWLSSEQIVEVAAGAEYAYDFVGAPWGRKRHQWQTGDEGLIMSGTSSDAYGTGGGQETSNAVFVGDGWGVKTLSGLAEFNFKPHPLCTFLASGRLDDNKFVKPMWSPRVALISDVEGLGIFKLVAQQSVRANALDQLLIQKRRGLKQETETLKSLELMAQPTLKDFSNMLNFNAFVNKVDLIGYTYGDAGTGRVGEVSLWGVEVEGRKTLERAVFGLNHSYLKMLRFKADKSSLLESDGDYPSNISMADFQNTDGGGRVMRSEGNDLLRWSNHVTKAFVRYKATDRLTLHADARVFYQFEGNKDAVESMRKAAEAGSSPTAQARVRTWVHQLRSRDVYEMDARLNASASYKWGGTTLTGFCQNLLTYGGHYRYYISANSIDTETGMDGIQAIQEPRVFGLRIDYEFR